MSLQEWVSTVTGKSLAMSALAQYHQAMVNAEVKDIGLFTLSILSTELAGSYESMCLRQIAGSSILPYCSDMKGMIATGRTAI